MKIFVSAALLRRIGMIDSILGSISLGMLSNMTIKVNIAFLASCDLKESASLRSSLPRPVYEIKDVVISSL